MNRQEKKELEWMLEHGTDEEKLEAYAKLFPEENMGQPAEVEETPSKDLPPGIKEALEAKKDLEDLMLDLNPDKVSIVSLDIFNGDWCFIARGPDPGFRFFGKYPVFWLRAASSGKIKPSAT